jgi:hypothetical protein
MKPAIRRSYPHPALAPMATHVPAYRAVPSARTVQPRSVHLPRVNAAPHAIAAPVSAASTGTAERASRPFSAANVMAVPNSVFVSQKAVNSNTAVTKAVNRLKCGCVRKVQTSYPTWSTDAAKTASVAARQAVSSAKIVDLVSAFRKIRQLPIAARATPTAPKAIVVNAFLAARIARTARCRSAYPNVATIHSANRGFASRSTK